MLLWIDHVRVGLRRNAGDVSFTLIRIRYASTHGVDHPGELLGSLVAYILNEQER